MLLIVPLRTNFIEIFNQNWIIFIQENAIENVVCEMASILSRPHCVKYAINHNLPLVEEYYADIH